MLAGGAAPVRITQALPVDEDPAAQALLHLLHQPERRCRPPHHRLATYLMSIVIMLTRTLVAESRCPARRKLPIRAARPSTNATANPIRCLLFRSSPPINRSSHRGRFIGGATLAPPGSSIFRSLMVPLRSCPICCQIRPTIGSIAPHPI